MGLISVIVPVYNLEAFIESCLNSIRRQSYKNIEVIVVDDGSTDGSGYVCDKLACLDKRFFVFHKEHEGLSSARNYGIDKAKGEYVVFIHCYNPLDINYKKERKRIVYDSNRAIIEMLYQRSFLVSSCAKIYPIEFFRSVKFPQGLLFEDSAIMCKVFEKAERITYSDARLYAYIHKEHSITNNSFSDKDFDFLTVSKQILNHYKSGDSKIKNAAYAYFINSCMRIYLNAPRNSRYQEKIDYCENQINKGKWKCLVNPRVRCKLKVALLLFIFNKKILFRVYKKVDRWS